MASQGRNGVSSDSVLWSAPVGRQWSPSPRWDATEAGQGDGKRWSLWSLEAPQETSRRELLSRESELEVGFGSSLLTFKALQADGPRG